MNRRQSRLHGHSSLQKNRPQFALGTAREDMDEFVPNRNLGQYTWPSRIISSASCSPHASQPQHTLTRTTRFTRPLHRFTATQIRSPSPESPPVPSSGCLLHLGPCLGPPPPKETWPPNTAAAAAAVELFKCMCHDQAMLTTKTATARKTMLSDKCPFFHL